MRGMIVEVMFVIKQTNVVDDKLDDEVGVDDIFDTCVFGGANSGGCRCVRWSEYTDGA